MQLREQQLQLKLSPKASSTAQIKIPDRNSGHSPFLAQLKTREQLYIDLRSMASQSTPITQGLRHFEPRHAVAAIAAILVVLITIIAKL